MVRKSVTDTGKQSWISRIKSLFKPASRKTIQKTSEKLKTIKVTLDNSKTAKKIENTKNVEIEERVKTHYLMKEPTEKPSWRDLFRRKKPPNYTKRKPIKSRNSGQLFGTESIRANSKKEQINVSSIGELEAQIEEVIEPDKVKDKLTQHFATLTDALEKEIKELELNSIESAIKEVSQEMIDTDLQNNEDEKSNQLNELEDKRITLEADKNKVKTSENKNLETTLKQLFNKRNEELKLQINHLDSKIKLENDPIRRIEIKKEQLLLKKDIEQSEKSEKYDPTLQKIIELQKVLAKVKDIGKRIDELDFDNEIIQLNCDGISKDIEHLLTQIAPLGIESELIEYDEAQYESLEPLEHMIVDAPFIATPKAPPEIQAHEENLDESKENDEREWKQEPEYDEPQIVSIDRKLEEKDKEIVRQARSKNIKDTFNQAINFLRNPTTMHNQESEIFENIKKELQDFKDKVRMLVHDNGSIKDPYRWESNDQDKLILEIEIRKGKINSEMKRLNPIPKELKSIVKLFDIETQDSKQTSIRPENPFAKDVERTKSKGKNPFANDVKRTNAKNKNPFAKDVEKTRSKEIGEMISLSENKKIDDETEVKHLEKILGITIKEETKVEILKLVRDTQLGVNNDLAKYMNKVLRFDQEKIHNAIVSIRNYNHLKTKTGELITDEKQIESIEDEEKVDGDYFYDAQNKEITGDGNELENDQLRESKEVDDEETFHDALDNEITGDSNTLENDQLRESKEVDDEETFHDALDNEKELHKDAIQKKDRDAGKAG